MKRSGLIGFVAAAALALAACGSSSDGSAAPATTLAPTSSATTTMSSESMSSSWSEPSSAPGSESSSESSADTSVSESQSSKDTSSESTTEAPTTTLNGTVDDATTTWFTTFCGGLGPTMTGLTSGLIGAMSGDPKTGQKATADIFDKVGDAFTRTAADLSATPPPTIDNGSVIAAKLIGAMSKAGPAYKDAATKVRSATVTSADDLTKLVEDTVKGAAAAVKSFDTGNYDLSPDLQKQLKEIPACKSFFGSS